MVKLIKFIKLYLIKNIAIIISVETLTTLSSYYRGDYCGACYVCGNWETGDLGEIHVVRPASGPKLPW
jgi:hypothetical protein